MLLSQSLHQEASAAYNELNDVYESILKIDKDRKILENMNAFPTFRLEDFNEASTLRLC